MNRHLAQAPAAGLGRRAAAVLLDLGLLLVAGGWLSVLIAVRTARTAADGGTVERLAGVPGWLVALSAAAVLVLSVAQWVVHGRAGWTFGRLALGVRTLDERTRRPIGMLRVLLRGLVVAAGSLVLGVGQFVVLLSPLLDRQGRRGWHDLAARDVVLDVRQAGRGAPPPPRPDIARAPTSVALRSTTSARASDADGRVPPPPPSPASGVPALAAVAATTGPVTQPLVLAPIAHPRSGPDLDTRALPLVPPPPRAGASAPLPTRVAAPVPPPPAATASDDRAPGSSRAEAEPAVDEDVETTRRRLPGEPVVPDRATLTGAVLALSDGQRVVVRRTALVGRNPAAAADGVQLVRVVDPGRSVSKTHLQVAVEPSGVWVADRGSTNGTVVTLPDGAQVICPVDHPVRLRLGSVVVFGDCSLRLVETTA